MPLPLFPDLIPVSQAEIDAWLDTLPNLSKSPFRRKAYSKAYHVEDKIRAWKKAGKWPQILEGESWASNIRNPSGNTTTTTGENSPTNKNGNGTQ